MPVWLSDAAIEDPVFADLSRELLTLQWHGDTFDLPEGAVLLASSNAYPHQAFRFGRAAYGVQFHVEVSSAMAEEWGRVPAYAEYLTGYSGPAHCPNCWQRSKSTSRRFASTPARCSNGGSRSPSRPNAAPE